MEILRFEEESAPAPKKKHRSKGLIALGLVATMMGAGTALATTSSTISINGGTDIQLGQGVTAVVGCDVQIGVAPVTHLASDISTFAVTSIAIGTGTTNPPSANLVSADCAEKIFKITLYSPSGSLVDCGALAFNTVSGTTDHLCASDKSIYFRVPSGVSDASYGILFNGDGFSLDSHPLGHISVETTSFDPGF